jgi:hypothetical protein
MNNYSILNTPPQRIDLRAPSSSIHNIPKYSTRRAPRCIERFPILPCLHCGNEEEKGCLRSRCLSSVTDNGLKYNLKPCIPVCLTNDAGHIALHLPQISENHPNHEGTVFSIFMLRTDRTSGHYHFDEMVNCFCHMSSVRSTSDGRGPVTRKRVPDREEPGKPRKDTRRGRYHSLE